jgi:hypothetical protein
LADGARQAGALAAARSHTHVLGFVGGKETDDAHRLLTAFQAGAGSAKVLAGYAGSDDDQAAAKRVAQGLIAQGTQPDSPPPGANDWSCHPTAFHPRPVVLVHGLLANQTDNWQTISPLLANHGYCVFSLTYGTKPNVSFPGYQPGGLAPMEESAQQLAGKKLGVSTIRGSDHLVAEELMQSKGFNPAQIQAVAIGESGLRMQALVAGVIDATAVSSPHDFMLRRLGFNTLAGPPELGVPGAGMFTSDRLLRENPQAIKGILKALLRAHQRILDNKPETLRAMLKWLPQQSSEVADHAYENELKSITRDGLMTDAEVSGLIIRFGEKKRPLDEVRDFSLARQAWKELEVGK